MKLGQLFFLLPLSYALDITNYPNALAVLGNGGPAGQRYPDSIGLFVQTGATQNGVPIWINGHGFYFYYDDYYYYDGSYGGWIIYGDDNYAGYIYHSSSSEKVPTRGFRYRDG